VKQVEQDTKHYPAIIPALPSCLSLGAMPY